MKMKVVYAREYQITPNTGKDCTKAFCIMLTENPLDTVFELTGGRYDF
jgi:hypothetical protein